MCSVEGREVMLNHSQQQRKSFLLLSSQDPLHLRTLIYEKNNKNKANTACLRSAPGIIFISKKKIPVSFFSSKKIKFLKIALLVHI